jgi:hypothetical protein
MAELPDHGFTRDRVVGFGHQLIKALIEPPPERPDSPSAQPGPRMMWHLSFNICER